jgi:hypothetical protein
MILPLHGLALDHQMNVAQAKGGAYYRPEKTRVMRVMSRPCSRLRE